MDQVGQAYGSAKSRVSSNSGAAVIVIVLLGLACLYLAYTNGYIPGMGGKSAMSTSSVSSGGHSSTQTVASGGNMGPGVVSGHNKGVALATSHPAHGADVPQLHGNALVTEYGDIGSAATAATADLKNLLLTEENLQNKLQSGN
jgi:hypothetical protein